MSDIRHRAAIHRVSPKGKGWDRERWFLEHMSEHLVRNSWQIWQHGNFNRYGEHQRPYSMLIDKWCVVKTSDPYNEYVRYTLSRAGWRQLIDLRNLDGKETK